MAGGNTDTGDTDRQKMVDCLFDPDNSEIMAELENGEKQLSELSSKSGLPGEQILSNLSCLIEAGILIKATRDDSVYLSVDAQKLSETVESDGNFDAAIEGLTKMDSYLN